MITNFNKVHKNDFCIDKCYIFVADLNRMKDV